VSRRRALPSDPAGIAARRAAAREAARLREAQIARTPSEWGPNIAALSLTANRAVCEVAAPGESTAKAARTRLQRRDVFDRFLAAGALSEAAFHASRRLQDDVALLHRSGAAIGAYAPRIDRPSRVEGFTEARHAAARRIEAALVLTGAASARLLLALCETLAALGRAADWRGEVAHTTGERLADAQGAVLRVACENLAAAYARLDREAVRARQAAIAARGSSVS
jgi:hypothetical protein